MFTDDEKDYIMRMIKEIARVLASVMLGKKYVQVELPVESKYQISGDKLYHMKTMVDNTPSHLAKMMIEGSTKGTIEITKKLKLYDGVDHPAEKLGQRLLKMEETNIEKLKDFLA